MTDRYSAARTRNSRECRVQICGANRCGKIPNLRETGKAFRI